MSSLRNLCLSRVMKIYVLMFVCFFSGSFVILSFIFMFAVLQELILVYDMRRGSRIIFLPMATQVTQNHSVKRPFFAKYFPLSSLSSIKQMSLSVFLTLFFFPLVCLFFCFKHTVSTLTLL